MSLLLFVHFKSLVDFCVFSNLFSSTLWIHLQTILPAGYFEEKASREIAEITELPLPIARAMIHAGDESAHDGLDERQILARRLELAEFVKKFISELDSKVHGN